MGCLSLVRVFVGLIRAKKTRIGRIKAPPLGVSSGCKSEG